VRLVVIVGFWEALVMLLELFECRLLIFDLSDRVLAERFCRRSNVLHGLPEQREVPVGVVGQGVECRRDPTGLLVETERYLG
jgi:hypothetical protein